MQTKARAFDMEVRLSARTDDSVTFAKIVSLIEDSCTIAISGHTDPDGDALGSVLAMTQLIAAVWPEKKVTPLLANPRPVMKPLDCLPWSDRLVQAASYDAAPDLFIALDTPVPDRLRDAAAVMERSAHVIKIDHHPQREPFGEVALVRTEAASTADIISDFIDYLGVVPSPGIATCVYVAVMTDTGRFQFQNANAHAFMVASRMVGAGANASSIAASLYQSVSLPAMRLRGLACERLTVEDRGRIAYSYVTLEDLASLGATQEDCDGLIDIIRELGDVDGCVFLRERAEGDVRGNARSKVAWLDVASIASAFGGGGHRAAAGFSFQGSMEDAINTCITDFAESAEAQAMASGVGDA